MNRSRILVALAACLVAGSGIYAGTNPQAVSLFSQLPSRVGEMTYHLLYEDSAPQFALYHSPKVGIKPRGEVVVETGAVLSDSVAAVTTQSKAAQLAAYYQQVLGASEISEDYINKLILNNLAASVATGWIASNASISATLQRASDSPRFASPYISSQKFTTVAATVNDLLTAKILSVTSDAAIAGNLIVTGDSTLQGILNVTGDTSLTGNLNVTGTITGNLVGSVNPGFTAGSVAFQGASGLIEDNSNLFWDNTNHYLGIGTATPIGIIDAVLTDLSTTLRVANLDSSSFSRFPAVVVDNYQGSSTFGFPSLSLRNYKGSSSSPLPILSGTILGRVIASGSKDTLGGTIAGATLQFEAEEDFSSTAGGSRISFYTAGLGSTSQTLRMRISADGNVGIGTTAPTAKLAILGNSSASSWTTSGIQLQAATATFTDTSSVAGSTIAARVGSSFARPNFASTNPITVTTAATLYVANSPFPSTNTTITNPLALWVAAGNSSFGGNLGIRVVDPDLPLTVASTSTIANQIRLRSVAGSINNGSVVGGIDMMSADSDLSSPGTVVASVQALSTTVQTASALDTALVFKTTSGTTMSEAMRILGNGNIGIGITTPTGKLHIAGNVSASSWTTSGAALQIAAATYTDTSSTAGATITSRTASSFASPTFASTNAIAITNASTLYIATPVAGSNVTITNNKPIDTQTTAYLSSGGTWTNASSRELKENFTALDSQEVLDKINSLNIEQWNYKAEDASVTHIGPVAEEFHAAFDTGGIEGDKTISTIDPAGVALLGIQGLSAKVKSLLDLSWVIDGFKQFGIEINQELTKIKSLAVDKLQIGSADTPSGFVMYDKATKEAYCVEIENGEFVKTVGECDNNSETEQTNEIDSMQESTTQPATSASEITAE